MEELGKSVAWALVEAYCCFGVVTVSVLQGSCSVVARVLLFFQFHLLSSSSCLVAATGRIVGQKTRFSVDSGCAVNNGTGFSGVQGCIVVSGCLSGAFASDESDDTLSARWRGGHHCVCRLLCMTANHQLAERHHIPLRRFQLNRNPPTHPFQNSWRQRVERSESGNKCIINARAESGRDFSNMSTFQINRSLGIQGQEVREMDSVLDDSGLAVSSMF